MFFGLAKKSIVSVPLLAVSDLSADLPSPTTVIPEPDYRKGVFVITTLLASVLLTAMGLVSVLSQNSKSNTDASYITGGIELGLATLFAISSAALYFKKPASINTHDINADNDYLMKNVKRSNYTAS